jgi:hypothetical protein
VLYIKQKRKPKIHLTFRRDEVQKQRKHVAGHKLNFPMDLYAMYRQYEHLVHMLKFSC